MTALDTSIRAWIAARISKGESIPDPINSAEPQGRLSVALPPSLRRDVMRRAILEGTSVNRWIVNAVLDRVVQNATGDQALFALAEPIARAAIRSRAPHPGLTVQRHVAALAWLLAGKHPREVASLMIRGQQNVDGAITALERAFGAESIAQLVENARAAAFRKSETAA